ncbi:uncharacterized protein [Primulina huaijiensis]|uniref:uncharacterized protein n=1 Tax=Primulina huaijiensis TaxID=1492673 RepID=UPI003CC7049F
MKTRESINEYDERVRRIINELNALGKVYSNKEFALKMVRGLPKDWDVKTMTMTMTMRESKVLNKVELHDLFGDLKAYEFEMQTREGEPSTPAATTTLIAYKLEPTGSVEKIADQLSNDAMSFFVKKFGKFMRRNQGSYQRNYQKSNSKKEPNSCFKCGKQSHFIADFPKPKKDSRHSTDKSRKSVEYKRRDMNDKKSFKKKHEVLLAEERKFKWAETNSGKSDFESSVSSSDDEEEVKCLMENEVELESTSEQVFDFSSTDFTQEELIDTLRDMVNEYHKLAHSFEKDKAEQTDPIENKTEIDESVEMLSLRREIAKQKAEMSESQSLILQLKNEISKLTDLIQAWNKSSVTLTEMQSLQKSVTDRTGLGFDCIEKISIIDTMPKFNEHKGKFINFVKSTMVQELFEPS